jgi:hypothetical protein
MKKSRKEKIKYLKAYINKLEQYIALHCESQVEFSFIEEDTPPPL